MNKRTAVAAEAAAPERSPSVARERILETATALFYQEGVRAVGVDLVVERSGVAKTSLYRHFATKDDLVVAFLEREDAEYWSDWDGVAEKAKGDPLAELEVHIRWIANHILKPTYRGCPFLNVATEFPDAAHPARAITTRHKLELHRRLAALAKGAGIRKPVELADQLGLLFDGAYMNGHLTGKKGPVRSFVSAGMALLQLAQNQQPATAA
ncbi:AcrR family transcriptional regulator [Variovorax boronicumulans]|uniref:TetR/AcrR family transcriptional regulator n=1 Tax=Variovorax boronicumulans TaxID=436515 RepID=UPI002473F215|nr:TetR/AcrR family transcriptional regulator [Variovorax boronicumulans]MDH6167666.1 AcrR family transcriptional regulator [Variovorax boronicumulans]